MDTSWKRNAAAYNNILIYTPIDQNNKLREEKKRRRRVLGGDRETRNSINNFFWHLFCLVASTDRATELKNSFWHLYFSPCSSVRQRARSCLPIPSSSLLILITHHINLKYFYFYQIWRWIDSLDDHDWRGGSESAVRLLLVRFPKLDELSLFDWLMWRFSIKINSFKMEITARHSLAASAVLPMHRQVQVKIMGSGYIVRTSVNICAKLFHSLTWFSHMHICSSITVALTCE